MARQPQAGHGGRGGGGRDGCGGRFPRQNEPGSLPCKSGEVGACKDLGPRTECVHHWIWEQRKRW